MVAEDDTTHTGQLLDRLRAGDRSAIEEILNLHRSYVRRVIELHLDPPLRSRVDPSDVVQETQMEVGRRIEDYLDRYPMSFRLWLRRTAMENLARLRRRHLNTQKRAVSREVSAAEHSSLLLARQLMTERPSQLVLKQERARQVRDAISTLQETDREILLLRHVEELTTAEIVELLHIDAAAASKRYGRALRRLREKLVEVGISRF